MSFWKIFIFMAFILFIFNKNAVGNVKSELINKEKWIKVSKTYDYSENFKSPKPSKSKPIHRSPSFFSGLSWVVYLLIGLIVVILISLIVWLTISLLKQRGNTLSQSKISIQNKTYENIEDADLEQELQLAISNGNLKDALRYQYLMVIKLLNRQRLVIWKKDKTNGHYLSEMAGKKGFDIFRKLTISFERVWYGDRELTNADYLKLIPVFEQIKQIIITP